MAAAIFNSTFVKLLKAKLSLNDTVYWLTGTADPSSSATDAPIGSIYSKTDSGDIYRKIDAGSSTNWRKLSSGGDSGINYATNSDAEVSVSPMVAYADAAASNPVDGTGGSPTTTATRTTSTPLRGIGSFLITKDAANRQGEGASYDFTIATADKAKPLTVSFEYQPSANFVAGDSSDIRVWLYDVTNSLLIQPTPYTIQGGSGATQKFSATFQTASNSTSYRLIWHIATTNASAWTFQIDTLSISPQVQLFGAPVSEWTSFTPTSSFINGNVTPVGKWRRVGDSMEIMIDYEFTGAPVGASMTCTIPNGQLIDTSKIGSSAASHQALGNAQAIDLATAVYHGCARFNSTTDVTFISDTGSVWSSTSPFSWGNGDIFSARFTVPIVGWGSNVVMSNDADTRVCAARISGDAASAADGAPIIFPTVAYDTHGAYNATTGRYTAALSGVYSVKGFLISASTNRNLWIYVDAVATVQCGVTDAGAGTGYVLGSVKVNAGQVIDVRPVGGALDASTNSHVEIERLSGPAAIAASEYIGASLYLGSAQNHTSSGSYVKANVDTAIFDTHGMLDATNKRWVCPAAGKYSVGAAIGFSALTTGRFGGRIHKNGSAIGPLVLLTATAAGSSFCGLPMFVLPLVPGDYLELFIYQEESASEAVATGAVGGTMLSISRQGI